MAERFDCAVVGGGHNGLVAGCYLALAGLRVVVLEQAAEAGGGSRTEETVPGFRFDTHSVAHNLVNIGPVPDDLGLAGAGLEYREMDPFAVAVFAGGPIVRFHRSVDATLRSIAEIDAREADAYARLMEVALPFAEVAGPGMAAGVPTGDALRRVARTLPTAVRLGGHAPRLLRAMAGSYGALLGRELGPLTAGPVAAFAAHGGLGPQAPLGGMLALWQGIYHRFGQWHAVGGSGALADALARRLGGLGGALRTGAEVTAIDAAGGRVAAVELASGERIATDAVVACVEPRLALLDLLRPALGGRLARRFRRVTRSNAVQAVVHVAASDLPRYDGAREGDWNGLQSYVDTVEGLEASFREAEARRLARGAAAYAFTPSAIDDTLAPPGGHTVYLASPAAPFDVAGGWERAGARLGEDLLAQVERRAPGFRESVEGVAIRTPAEMAAELHWPGAHPMHVDVTLRQLGPLRPLPELGRHRTPVPGLYLGGAGSAPTGGVSGLPGRGAAHALLRDLRRRRAAGLRGPRLR